MDSEIIARRRTYDGRTVLLWSDGALTSGMGGYVRGGRLEVGVAWLVADEAALFTWEELPGLVKAAKRLAKRGRPFLPGDLRKAAHGAVQGGNGGALCP